MNVEPAPGGGYYFDADFDLKPFQESHKRHFPNDGELTPALLLAPLPETLEQLYLQSFSEGDYVSPRFNSELLRYRLDAVVARSLPHEHQIDAFEEVVNTKGRSIRDAVNDGSVSIKELLSALKDKPLYHAWLSSVDPNAELLDAYMDEINRVHLLGKLPSKMQRFLFFTGATKLLAAVDPVTGMAVGASLSGFNTFFYDKLAAGWKPNQYIEEIYD